MREGRAAPGGAVLAQSKNKNANLHGLAFRLTLFLVARGGIEPPTQGFSILCSTN